jgi:hypothetical protein
MGGKEMKLWLLTQSERSSYDTFDSVVVAAMTEVEAAMIDPGGNDWEDCDKSWFCWASTWKNVSVELLGTAKEGTKAGVICSSFNAG